MANPLNVDAAALLQKQGLPMNANNLNRAMNMLAGAQPVEGGAFDVLGQDAPFATAGSAPVTPVTRQALAGPPPSKPAVPPSQVQPAAGSDSVDTVDAGAAPAGGVAGDDGYGLLGILSSLLGLSAAGGARGKQPSGGRDGDVLGPEAPKAVANKAEPTTLEAHYMGTDAPQVTGPDQKIKRLGQLQADRTANGGEPSAGAPSRSFSSIHEDSMQRALEDHGGPTNVTPGAAPKSKVVPMPDNVQGGRLQQFIRSLKPAELEDLARIVARMHR